uniref:Serine protease n=1 Tax=Astyanax mexicanus TaxID=7994 RepID=A0A3B1J1L6_ASTMX
KTHSSKNNRKSEAFFQRAHNSFYLVITQEVNLHMLNIKTRIFFSPDHFPCHLITEEELLCIHTFTEEKDQKDESTKVKDEGAQDAEDAQKTKPASGELITFTVESKGGKDTKTKQIVRNKILKKFKTLGVYAYSEDTIKEALKRDGRFADIVFDDRCEFHLNDKTTFEILLQLKSSNMPDFGEIYGILRSQFPELVKCMEARKSSKLSKEYLKLRKEDFAQSTRAFSTMCQLEKLVNVGTSVCTVKTANMQGTGFLLFDNFILTNAHVIEETLSLKSEATVNFNKGSGTSLDREFLLCTDVFAFLKGRDDAGRYVDFALLKLQDSEEIMKNEDIPNLPRILKEYTSNQHAGGICIIGHPGSDVKRMDVSCIVPHKATGSAPGDSSIRVSLKFSPNYSEFEVIGEHSFIATYNTCFLHGSSGSPVFDEPCKLVAMHTGGFLTDGNKEHIIEFGIPLHSIIQNIIKQLASRESLDVMFKFIEAAAQNPHLEEYLKEYHQEIHMFIFML